MSIPSQPPKASREEIVRSLTARARELWGYERSEALRELIAQTADHIWQISQDPAPPDEEPAFYF